MGTAPRSLEVVVVGGGVIGMSIAWRAARAGFSVAVVDDPTRAAASNVAAGMLAPVTEAEYGEERLLQLNLESSRRYEGFVEELMSVTGHDVGYVRCGTLTVARDLDDNTALEDVYRFQQSLGLTVERLRGSACRTLEPLLAPRTRGGILVEGDHQVDPTALVAALTDACKRDGVALHESGAASLTTGPRPEVVLRTGERLACTTVVVAAGTWSGSIDGMPPAALPPVRPVKGQLVHLRTRDGDPFTERNIRGLDVYVVSRPDGRVIVGATVEEQGFDATVTAGATYELLRNAYELLPGITELAFVASVAGLRPGTPDNAPIIGRVEEGVLVATGHYRNGILLAPVTADAIVDLLMSDRVPDSVAPFGPERFATVAAR
ncbi:MAG: glycine oxidase ThiO [Actinomycetota bacterium]